jgi:inhibitor of cysteine peptidase
MKTAPISTLLALLALSLMTGCQTKAPIRTVTAADNGGTVQISMGDLLEVHLEGNPSTGYAWMTQSINSWVLAPLGRPHFTPAGEGTNSPALVGAGGLISLRYQPVGRGTTPLKLNYRRTWETNVTPAQTFEITVTVR